MKAIVVVFAPTREAIKLFHGLKRRAKPSFRKANCSLELSERDQFTSPFWTWFIENPRSYGAK